MKNRCGRTGGGRGTILAGVVALGLAGSASAELTLFFGQESLDDWEAAVKTWETMDFTGFSGGEPLDDQYQESLGVFFTDSTSTISFGPNVFPRDSWGMRTGTLSDVAEFTVETPIRSLGFFFPGSLQLRLWLGEEFVGETGDGSGGLDKFFGFISDEPFDRVEIFDPGGIASIDDIRLAMQVPAPGALALLAAGFLVPGRRRRSV